MNSIGETKHLAKRTIKAARELQTRATTIKTACRKPFAAPPMKPAFKSPIPRCLAKAASSCSVWYTEEQSLSIDYHRYGNLGARANEKRNGPV